MPPTLQAFRRQYPSDNNVVLGRVPSLRPNIITEDAATSFTHFAKGGSQMVYTGRAHEVIPPCKKRKDEALSAAVEIVQTLGHPITSKPQRDGRAGMRAL
jgi:hypothetical protein